MVGIDKKTKENLKKLKNAVSKDEKCIKVKEGKLFFDEDTECYSFKTGGVSIYIVPKQAQLVPKDHEDMKVY